MQFCEKQLLHKAEINSGKHPCLYIKANTDPRKMNDYEVYDPQNLKEPTGYGFIVYRHFKPFIEFMIETEKYYVSLSEKKETYE